MSMSRYCGCKCLGYAKIKGSRPDGRFFEIPAASTIAWYLDMTIEVIPAHKKTANSVNHMHVLFGGKGRGERGPAFTLPSVGSRNFVGSDGNEKC